MCSNSRSIFRQAEAIPPGHVLHLGPFGEPRLERFWEPRVKVREGFSEADWIEQTREQVLATVNRHMIADVPVGAFLSGGIDSGAVAAAMVRARGAGVTLFTAGFPGSKIDETEAAQAVAQHLGCEHIVPADRAGDRRGGAARGAARVRRANGSKLGRSVVVSVAYCSPAR